MTAIDYTVICACCWNGRRSTLANVDTWDVCCPSCRRVSGLRDGPNAAEEAKQSRIAARAGELTRRAQ